jgi:hypothetical protein
VVVVLSDVHPSSQDDRQAVALLADLGERFSPLGGEFI